MRFKSLVLVGAVFLGGCLADLGPVRAPRFESVARQDLSLPEGPLLLYGPAVYWPGTDAWGFHEEPRPQQGVLIILDTQLYLATWNLEISRYEATLTIDYEDIREIRMRVWGAARRFVLELKTGDLHAYAFGQTFIDRPQTNKGYELIKERISPKNTVEPTVLPNSEGSGDSIGPSIEERLRTLKHLYENGTIDEESYETHKQRILESL